MVMACHTAFAILQLVQIKCADPAASGGIQFAGLVRAEGHAATGVVFADFRRAEGKGLTINNGQNAL